MIYNFIKHFILAFFSSAGFSVIFNAPRNCIIKSGLSGAFGWLVYKIINSLFFSSVAGSFLGAITVGFLGEVFARFFKKPATVFIIPGIVPLVPGAGMYYTMLAIIEKRFIDAANKGSEVLFIAAAIASGIIISSSISQILSTKKKKRKKI
ncbi:threonine/serine exporter family protein [Clostridiisalibacter paucivorans]|uniref:threonine/serine exporter family protein n=1 Tax=Clostridiisalibacter paucivorans TaxID=408753 RepID=UPI00047AE64C|nr:threonine/serine exporter family protein [Clostridiisalibacter paucivorans]